MKHLLKATGDITSADYERILLNEDGSVISQMGGGVKPIEYQAIDLGLPSGLKWCNMNVGASSPEDDGLYFQWGDTQGYTVEQVLNGEKVFDDNSCKYYDADSKGYIKYNKTDGKTVLDPEDDAARANMGDSWRMPTYEELIELIQNTDVEIEYYNGTKLKITNDYDYMNDIPNEERLEYIDYGIYKIKGIRCYKKNTNIHIFIPSCFYLFNEEVITEKFYVGLWSSRVSNHYIGNTTAGAFWFDTRYLIRDDIGDRSNGFPVRAVLAQ